uniref:Uncharacterized protein n=1 Tax=Siphoviridae sp. ctOkv13 TaxID=2826314 RepID=A0A8S5M2Z6_9CAUD|nr:MAG TPA: hypothetical protein [Siphoviridae sp. ctOkv13]
MPFVKREQRQKNKKNNLTLLSMNCETFLKIMMIINILH